MEIVTEKDKMRNVLARWERQYGDREDPDKQRITEALRALDWNTATAADVEKIIGNRSWTQEFCGECDDYSIPAVRFNNDSTLCAICIGKAAVLAAAFAKLK